MFTREKLESILESCHSVSKSDSEYIIGTILNDQHICECKGNCKHIDPHGGS